MPGTKSPQSDYDLLGIAAAQIIKAINSMTDQAFQQNPLIATEITHNPREPPSQIDTMYENTPVPPSVSSGLRGTDLKQTHLQGQKSSRGFRNFMPRVLFQLVPRKQQFQRPHGIFSSILGILSDRTLRVVEGRRERALPKARWERRFLWVQQRARYFPQTMCVPEAFKST